MAKLPRLIIAVGMTGAVLGCSFFAPGPEEVAQDFWDASMDGDFERASEYVTEASRSMLDRADDAPAVEDVSLGEVEIDGERATVQTMMVAMMDDRPREVEFSTILEKEDNRWKVNLNATTGQMITKFMGGAAGEFMSQLGEAMGEQMRGIMEGMMKGFAEGMQEMGRDLQEEMDSTGN